MEEWILLLLRVLFLPLYLLMRLVEETSGEGRWYRQRKYLVVCERAALPDEELVRRLNLGPDEAVVWIAVRSAVAKTIGVPSTAIHPDDRLADVWRMQWLGPDLRQVIYFVERSLKLKIRSRAICMRYGEAERRGQMTEFADFASLIVAELRGR